jgi:hypothetical protein
MNTRRFFADRGISLGLMVLAAVVVLVAPAAWADPPSRAARLNYVSGAVSLAPAGLPDEWGEAFVNRPLTVGDRLWADTGARAELRLGSTALRIDGGTSLDVLDINDRMLQVSIDQGRAQVRTRGGNGGNAEIDTPAAAVVVTGAADVRVDVDASTGRTFIAVRSGRANVYTPSESFDLASGETTRIDADGRYYTIGRAAARDAFDNFAYTRDVRWREPRYVSAEMTGYEDLDSYGAWQPAAEYGNVWFPRQVATDWVPYRDGRWVWVEPWGWTWVDNAPWGFAPFHYGRWVQVNNRWGWWPGERVQTPVYAPALVAFFGGDNFGVSVTVGAGPAVGWFPLGYRDPYIPWYTASPAYRRSVNVAYVRDPVVLNQVVNITNVNITNVTNIRYAHRDRDNVATMVPRQAFVSAQPVRQAAVAVSPQRVASANIISAAPAAPERASLVGHPGRTDRAPRADRANKPVVAVNAPAAAPPRFEQRVQEAQQAQGKPFEVKPLRDDRREAPNRTAQTTPQPGAAPAANAAASTGRDVRVIKPAPAESRQARDRGAGQGQAQQGRGPQEAQPAMPQAGTPPTARTAPGNDREAQQREAQQRDSQQREAQQRQGQQREAQDRAAQQREGQQREAQQRETQQREAQQREAQQRQSQQREAQDRAAQQRETQQREAQQREAQQREAQQREAQQRQSQQREGQERAAQQRDAQQREAQQRQTQQREAQERTAQAQQHEAQQREQQRAQQQAQARREPPQQAQPQPEKAQPQPEKAQPQPEKAQPQPKPAQPSQPQQAQGKGPDQARSDRTDDERKRDERDERKGRDRQG